MISGEKKEEDISATSVYYFDEGDFFAEYVEQDMAVLPDGTTALTKITIDYVQVRDPGIPLAED